MHKSVDGRGAAPLAEACNTGFEPLVRLNAPALRRSRLSWVRQNYVRAETLTRANARIVAAQASIPLARAWGGGDVASADGLARPRGGSAAPSSRWAPRAARRRRGRP